MEIHFSIRNSYDVVDADKNIDNKTKRVEKAEVEEEVKVFYPLRIDQIEFSEHH